MVLKYCPDCGHKDHTHKVNIHRQIVHRQDLKIQVKIQRIDDEHINLIIFYPKDAINFKHTNAGSTHYTFKIDKSPDKDVTYLVAKIDLDNNDYFLSLREDRFDWDTGKELLGDK